MQSPIKSIRLDRLIDHPDNPNRQSKATFAKLVRHIERTGRYEPLVVRPHPGKEGYYQIINGHHRRRALARLGYERADCIVWDIDDTETSLLLATLNRLCGSDDLSGRLKLLRRLSQGYSIAELAKLVPESGTELSRLTKLKLPDVPAEPKDCFAKAVVFFLDQRQEKLLEQALAVAGGNIKAPTKAAKRAAALAEIAGRYLQQNENTR